MAGNPMYELTTAYPEVLKYYGLLSGSAFTLSYSVMGIFAGRISDNVTSRKNLLALACIVMSATSLLTGSIDSFLVLVVMRFILGLS